jgi:HEPN domain-containing protein
MLYTLALGDESVLQYPLPDHIYGFHPQQSCEKLLKALISAHDSAFPFTHRFGELLTVLTQYGEVLPTLPYRLLLLEPFAVQHRYDLNDALSEHERRLMRESVVKLREHVVARILELERGLNP